MEGVSNPAPWWKGRPFGLWVIFGGLVYSGLGLLALIVLLIRIAASSLIVILVLVFAAVFFVTAFFCLRGKRWALITAAASTAVFFILNIPEILQTGSNPADSTYWLTMSLVPAFILVLFFSILSIRNVKRGIGQKRYLATHESAGGLFTLGVVGFVIGALLSGAIGAAVINRLIEDAGRAADVLIVEGAPSAPVPFTPASLTVSVGDTVTWLNTDSLAHTITSDTGAFESGPLTPGARWSFTFTQAGTYPYHCTPHPQMTGTIVVQ